MKRVLTTTTLHDVHTGDAHVHERNQLEYLKAFHAESKDKRQRARNSILVHTVVLDPITSNTNQIRSSARNLTIRQSIPVGCERKA